MKKLLVIVLIVCVAIIGYMVINHDTEVTSSKVLDWLQDYVPEQIDKIYAIDSVDIEQNDDGSIIVMIHCIKNAEEKEIDNHAEND